MDQHKLDSFSDQNHGARFPAFDSLPAAECQRLCAILCLRLGLAANTSGKQLVTTVWQRIQFTRTIPIEGQGIDLEMIVGDPHGLKSNDWVYLDWHQFDRIDRIRRADLANFFYDIWYPGADDIEIFDDSMLWMTCVRHDCQVGDLRW